MRHTRLPKYLQFDHILHVSDKDFTTMEGKEYYHFIYCGQKTFKEGEWILFQNDWNANDFQYCRKLIRKVKSIVGQVPLLGIEDCTELILYSEIYDRYAIDHYETEHFVNEGSVIKTTESSSLIN